MKKIYNDSLRLQEDYGLDHALRSAGSVLVCFSGGADSAVLLRLMLMLAPRFGFSVYAAHINHMLRGAEADRDQLFCEETCRTLGVPLFSVRRNAELYSRTHSLSCEEGARQVRYRFFENVLSELEESHRRPAVAVTAHNADDNMETVLFNLCRGCGTKGAAGIPPVRGKFLRPMIYSTSDEIRRCCAEEGFGFVTDSTNLSDDYTRNRLRHNVTPVLRELFPAAADAVSRACFALRRDSDYLDNAAENALSAISDGLGAERNALRQMGEALLVRVIGIMHRSADGGDLSMKHYMLAADFIRGKSDGCLDLPGNIIMECRDKVKFIKRGTEEKASDLYAEFPLLEGENNFPEYGFSLSLTLPKAEKAKERRENENIYKISIHTAVDFDKISGKLYVRFRRAGDHYRYGGVNRSVKKLLCDKKIPPNQRSTLPFVCDSDGILWIPGFPPRDCSKVVGDASSEKAIILEYYSTDR